VTKSKSPRRAGSQRGAYFVEYSLVILIFLFVLFGIMEFGRIVTAYNVLSGATREGTRYAIVHGSRSGAAATATDVQTEVRRWCIGLDSSSVTVTTTWPSGNAPGAPVTVTTTYGITPLVGFISPFSIGSRSQMVISQ
jgi:Flp pilus assembly protein TadG